MVKFILWTIGLIIGVPTAFVAFNAFMVFVFYPWLHPRNVERMDAKNDLVWEEAIARIVTVEAELGTMEGTEKLTTDVVCYEGYFARAWNLKDGGPDTGFRPKSIGFEALQAVFPTGATLDIDLSYLCSKVFRMENNELPLKLGHNQTYIVAPELSLYCPFYNSEHSGRSKSNALQTDAGWVGHPYIVAIEMRPLRTLATRSEMGSSEVPSVSSGFARRWEWATRTGKSHWNAEKACWTDRVGRCDEALTYYCGKNPR